VNDDFDLLCKDYLELLQREKFDEKHFNQCEKVKKYFDDVSDKNNYDEYLKF
jgi:hypothetical protein